MDFYLSILYQLGYFYFNKSYVMTGINSVPLVLGMAIT